MTRIYGVSNGGASRFFVRVADARLKAMGLARVTPVGAAAILCIYTVRGHRTRDQLVDLLHAQDLASGQTSPPIGVGQIISLFPGELRLSNIKRREAAKPRAFLSVRDWIHG